MARHVKASKVDAEAVVDGRHVILTVVDDGVGIPANGRRSGSAADSAPIRARFVLSLRSRSL